MISNNYHVREVLQDTSKAGIELLSGDLLGISKDFIFIFFFCYKKDLPIILSKIFQYKNQTLLSSKIPVQILKVIFSKYLLIHQILSF